MAPKIVDQGQKRRELADAALRVVMERGVDAASIAHVAKAAGISKGTVYLYFDSKEALLVAAARRWVEQLRARATPPAPTHDDARDAIRALLEASIAGFMAAPDVLRVFLGMTEFFLRAPELQRFAIAREVSSPMRAAITALLIQGAQGGQFRTFATQEAEAIATNIVAFVDGLGLHYATGPDQLDVHHQLGMFLDLQFQALAAPGATP
jgi:AcrR family transcriptional regulator